MNRPTCSIFAAVALSTAMFVSLPLSFSCSPSSSWQPRLTMNSAQAFTYGHARRVDRRLDRRDYRYARRAHRYSYVAPAYSNSYYGHADGASGYPYSAGYYAYRGVYAAPVVPRHWWWGLHRRHWWH
jgi:hypothetical protein